MSNKFISTVLFSKPLNRNQRPDFTLPFTFHRGRYIETQKSPPLFKAIFGYLKLLTLIKLHQTQQPQQAKLMPNQRQWIAYSIFFKLSFQGLHLHSHLRQRHITASGRLLCILCVLKPPQTWGSHVKEEQQPTPTLLSMCFVCCSLTLPGSKPELANGHVTN